MISLYVCQCGYVVEKMTHFRLSAVENADDYSFQALCHFGHGIALWNTHFM
jgi:hypothetical protein